MKKNIYTNLFSAIKSSGILAVVGGMLVMSCGAQMGGYSETDGVYYDPNTDTLPEGVIIRGQENRVGDYYDYNAEPSVLDHAQANAIDQRRKYSEWSDATDSDFGNYAGSETNYYSNSWGWGSPWGWGGFGMGWGLGFGYGWGWGSSFAWGSPWAWGGYGMGWGWNNWYSPFWGMYNPYWGGYNGMGYYGGFYNNGFYGNYAPLYRRSTANGYGFTDRNSNIVTRNSNPAAGFRNSNSGSGFRNSNTGGFRNNSVMPRSSMGTRNGGFRNPNGYGRDVYSQPRPNYGTPQQSQPNYRNDGYRSGGFSSPNTGGGFRGGGSVGGGGMRSGGGFRGGR